MARTPHVTLDKAVMTCRVWLKPRGESQRLKRIASIPCHCLCMCVRAHVLLHSIVLSVLVLVAMPPQESVKSDGQLVTTPPTTGPTDGTLPVGPDSDDMPVRVVAIGKTDRESYSDKCLEASLKNGWCGIGDPG